MNNDLISREDLKQNLFVLFGNQLPNGLLEYIDSIKAYNTSTLFIDPLQVSNSFGIM